MSGRLSVANLADRANRKFGDRVLAIREEKVMYKAMGPNSDGITATYGDSYRAANAVAAAMKNKYGIRAGDRIAIYLTNVPEMGLSFMANSRIGAITVPFNYMLKASEIKGMTEDCGAKVMVTEPDLFEANIKDKSNVPGIEHWVMVGPRERVPDGFISVDELTEGYEDAYIEPMELDPNEPIAIFYTSGTTGFPKGAMLTSRNCLSTVTKSVRLLRLGRKDFGIAPLPLAHIFGFNTQIIGGLFSGASGYLMRFFDPEKALKLIEEHRATIFIGVPAMYNLMLQSHPEKYDLSSMRYWFSGADAMPVEQIKRFEKLGGRFIEGYGLVETSPIISVNLPFLRKHGSVGRPVPGVHVRIMDENGNFLKRGEVGEIVVRGPNVMKGYWNDEGRTSDAFRHGWFHTGDMGYRDRLVYIYFVDREKDVVKVGGYSVFSREVEEEILNHPKVHEVGVVGQKDPVKGQVPVAFIQLKEGERATEEELLEWCRENIASYRRPRRIRIIDEMPLTMTLKVLKTELRKMLEEEEAKAGA